MGTHTRHALLQVRDVLNADPDRFTSNFYLRLFATNPELRELFPANMGHQRAMLFRVIEYVLETVPDRDNHPRLLEFLGQLGRDHRKYGVTEENYHQFFAALMREIAVTMGDRWDEDFANVVSQAFMLTTGVMRGAAHSAPGPATWQAVVAEKYRLSRDLAVVRLKAAQPLTFAAGQYLEVQIPQWPRIWRHFSPSIPPNPDGELEFHVRAVPGGSISNSIVTETQVGDVWQLAQSHGTLTVDTDRDVLMIAGGTGLAPLRALLIELSFRADAPAVHLFYGARYPADLYDLSRLWRMVATNPWLTVTTVVEDDTDPWWSTASDESGRITLERVQGQLADAVLGYGRDWTQHQVLLAGSPEMIANTRRRLLIAGLPASKMQHDPV
ncbi:FAD-binding oxidoreductase [Williamsia soli]|uniref:FAD-binding oxidoreductase n=1 Tax=Williamsia soli TaxID=364929 RepID=UPI001A9D8EDA|nr:FAD-binding oxidoreductase [Williamsia soli]